MEKLKPLIDNFGRQITYLRISVTDRCNLRCVYCMPESGVALLNHDEVISYEDILRLVNILSNHGVNKIRITGGEPFRYSKSLRRINIKRFGHIRIPYRSGGYRADHKPAH